MHLMRHSILGLGALAHCLASASPHPRQAEFTHPGLLHTQKDFDRIQGFVNDKKEPWLTGWAKLEARANADYSPNPVEIVYRGTGSPENYANLFRDAAAAYANAVHWKISGDEAHAQAAARILDGWSSTLKTIDGSSDKFLASGLYGYQLANAGEILRDFPGWDGLPNLIAMMDVFYRSNHRFLVEHNGGAIDHYWANWDLCNLCSMHAIGVLSDNRTMADEAINYFKTGGGNGAIEKAIWKMHEEEGTGKPLGQIQESGRDQGHTALDIALLGTLAQQSFNQGEDLFELLDNRILAGSEYAAKYNLGNDVPYTPYQNSDVTQDVISEAGRGNIRPAWELIYNHYAIVKGLDAEWSRQYRDLVVEKSGGAEGGGGDYGPNSGGYDQLGFGTLLYRLE